MDFVNKISDKVKVYLPSIQHYANNFLNLFKNIFGIYVLWVLVHYVAAHIYVRFCTPATFMGFILSHLWLPHLIVRLYVGVYIMAATALSQCGLLLDYGFWVI